MTIYTLRQILLSALVCLTVTACAPDRTCDFASQRSDDNVLRIALLISPIGPSIETQELTETLAELDFPDGNICVLQSKSATLDRARQAIKELARTGDRDAHRFLYLSTDIEAVIDNDGDEPDEQDETLLFAEFDGLGAGEMRDDEIVDLVHGIQSKSSGSLVVLNVQARPDSKPEVEPRTDRDVESVGSGDGHAFVGGMMEQGGMVIVASRNAPPALIYRAVTDALRESATHTPSSLQFGRRAALRTRNAGVDVEVFGGGSENLFGLERVSLTALGGTAPRLTLKLRDAALSGGLGNNEKSEIAAILQDHAESVEVVEVDGDFELSRVGDGEYLLRGPDNRARNRFSSLDALPNLLEQHRQQRRILSLRGSNNGVLTDHESVRVDVRPIVDQLPCANGEWDLADAGEVQDIPLCYQWYVDLGLSEGISGLYATVLILSADGKTLAVPGTGYFGADTGKLNAPNQIYGAGPPVDVIDQVFVIASTEPVDADGLIAGTASIPDGAEWSVSAREFRVVANSAFVQRDELSQREYTIKNFDIRPYLPDNDNTNLSRFVRAADELAKSSVTDGYSYKQHDWKQPTDALNLATGIDCSRAIWYAFKKSGLKYNRNDRYLATADMVTSDSWMQDEFDRCPVDGNFVIGDILVYRSHLKGDGHVVSVIDAERRIAWGSHGWDGTPNVDKKLRLEPDTGVEYQKIRVKKDWLRWDRNDMELRACWRYRQFSAELRNGLGPSGSRMLGVTCGEPECEIQ